MTNIVIIFVLSTNATCCILLDKNKNIYATFLIIFVGEAVFMFQKIILELTLIDAPILVVSIATAIAMALGLTSCNVTRTITTESRSVTKGDTAIIIQSKTIESYNAKKN